MILLAVNRSEFSSWDDEMIARADERPAPVVVFQFKPSKLYRIVPDEMVPAIMNLLMCHATLWMEVGEVLGNRVVPRPAHVAPKSSL